MVKSVKTERVAPPSAYRCTDTTAGNYVVVLRAGSAFDEKLKIRETISAEIHFCRDSDGVHEHAMSFAGYYLKDDPHGKRSRARANVQLGRLRAHLKRHGKRWEYQRQQEADAKRAKEKADSEARKRVREAAPDLLAALTALWKELHPATIENGKDARLYIGGEVQDMVRAAIDKAGEWPVDKPQEAAA